MMYMKLDRQIILFSFKKLADSVHFYVMSFLIAEICCHGRLCTKLCDRVSSVSSAPEAVEKDYDDFHITQNALLKLATLQVCLAKLN